MGDVLKTCLYVAFDKKVEARDKTCLLLKGMHTDGLLSTQQVHTYTHFKHIFMYYFHNSVVHIGIHLTAFHVYLATIIVDTSLHMYICK
jgi:hypothetical protein